MQLSRCILVLHELIVEMRSTHLSPLILASLLPCAAALLVTQPLSARRPVAVSSSSRQDLQMSLVLTEENVATVLEECQVELGTLFGSNAQSLKVGITGAVELVELDGPTVVVKLTGRFWHKRSTVIERVESYVLERIPECIGVEIDNIEDLDDTDKLGDPADLLEGKER